MRYNKAHSRALAIITAPDVPRRADGHIRLCQFCQRCAFYAGGLMDLLAADLERMARCHWIIVNAQKRRAEGR